MKAKKGHVYEKMLKSVVSFALLLIVVLSCLCACGEMSDDDVLDFVSGELGVDISTAGVIQYKNTQSFFADGEIFVTLEFADDELLEQIEDDGEWGKYPLPSSFDGIVRGEENRAPLWSRPASIQNGYYYFKDRHSESDGSNDPGKVKERISVNFTMAVYDTDSNTLYYYKINT